MSRKLRHLQAGIDALVRAAFIDPSSLPYPERLTAGRFRLLSQKQEDGILWSLFQQIGVKTNPVIKEYGAAQGLVQTMTRLGEYVSANLASRFVPRAANAN